MYLGGMARFAPDQSCGGRTRKGPCQRSREDRMESIDDYATERTKRRTHRLASEKGKVVANGSDLSRFRALNGPRLFDLVFLGAPSLYRDVPSLLKAFDALVSLRGSVKILWLGWREAPLPPGAAALLK